MFLTFFKVFPKISEKNTLWAHFPGHSEYTTLEHFGCIVPCILNFTGWVNYGYFIGDIVKNTLDDPPRNTVGTFFGNILNFPTHFLIRKSPGNTVNGLNTSQARLVPFGHVFGPLLSSFSHQVHASLKSLCKKTSKTSNNQIVLQIQE
jgi:hypothetical protein